MEVAEEERREAKDDLHLRQAGEKAWLAVVQATDEFLSRRQGILPPEDAGAYVARKQALRGIGASDLAEEYNALSGLLHADVFCFGDLSQLPSLMARARRYVDRATGLKVGSP